MSNLTTLKENIYDDVTSVMTSYVGSPHIHVIREDDAEPDSPPMVALDGRVTDRSSNESRGGMHTFYVFDMMENPFDVEYGEERTFEVDVTVSDTDGDRADNILDDIHNAFTYDERFAAPSTFIPSMIIDDVRVEDTSPTDRNQRVGHTLAIEVDFVRTFLYSEVDDPPSAVTKVVQNYESLPTTVTTTESGVTLDE